MRSRPAHGEQGITVVELAISLSIFVIILLAVTTVFDVHNPLFASGERKVDVQYNARFSMAQMTKQIRVAGYYPENFDANAGNNLVSPVPIQVATNSALAIFGDDDGNGTSNLSLYCLAGTSLMRATTFDCNQGQTLGRGITSLRFTYYDANNDPIPNPLTATYELDGEDHVGTPDLTPGDLTERSAIRRVVITLTAQMNVPGQQPQRYTLTSDIRLRNLN